jgi:hypothetical protein
VGNILVLEAVLDLGTHCVTNLRVGPLALGHAPDRSDAKRPLRLLTRTDTSGLMLWFFLLVLVLGLVFGWHVAAVLLVLWLIGYVGFWLFMLCKPVKGDY